MIKARHNKVAEFIYNLYMPLLLKSHFSRFLVSNEIPVMKKNKGLIITPNHFSWWDGFFADYLMKHYKDRTANVMMLEEQLKKYFFFKYLGAFSIKTGSIKSIKESLNYAGKIIADKKNYLIFYPQGEIQQYGKGFIKLKDGLKYICENIDADILTVSFKIFYENKKKPAVICRFGELINSKSLKENFSAFEVTFNRNIELLEADNNYESYTDLFKK